MSAYAADGQLNTRRAVSFVAIVAIHLFIGWAFVSGFGKQIVSKIIKDVEISTIDETQKEETPPPPPKPDIDLPPPVVMPPPLINITVPVDAPPPIAVITNTPPPPAPVATIPSTAVTLVKPRNPDEYYPEQSNRLNEEGKVTIRLCVAADGKFEGEPSIQTSSGVDRLDQAALRWAKDVRQARPATVNGKPVSSCKGFLLNFKNPNKR